LNVSIIFHILLTTWWRCSYKPRSPCLDHNSLIVLNTHAATEAVFIFKQSCIYYILRSWILAFPIAWLQHSAAGLLLWQTNFQSCRTVIVLLETSMVDRSTFSQIMSFLLHHKLHKRTYDIPQAQLQPDFFSRFTLQKPMVTTANTVRSTLHSFWETLNY
jgi:hypothetical protein